MGKGKRKRLTKERLNQPEQLHPGRRGDILRPGETCLIFNEAGFKKRINGKLRRRNCQVKT